MGFENVKEFNRQLLNWGEKQIPEDFNLARRKIAIDILSGVIEMTPVDTGRARGGWVPSLDAPSESEGKTDTSGTDTLNRGIQVIATSTPWQTIWISNNVEYIGYLENGTDRMPPVGMVSHTINRLLQVF